MTAGLLLLLLLMPTAGPDGKPELPPPGAWESAYPEGVVNLLRNPGFEEPNAAGDGPVHWQGIDGLVYHWTVDPSAPQRGKVLKINTDVSQGQAYRWWIERYVRGAALDAAPRREPTREPKYDTIAGLDGGFFWSDPIEVKEGGAYRVYVDARGPGAKVFLRGYVAEPVVSFGDEQPAVQELFRAPRGEPTHDAKGRPIKYRMRYRYTTWFSVGGSDEWKTYSHRAPRHPNNRELTEDVRWVRVMLYPYWPPGEYWFDNVRVVETDPAENAGVPEGEEADFEEGKIVR